HDALVALRLADGTPVTARVLGTTEPVPVGAVVSLTVAGSGHAYPA
ncbi:MAG TPA: ABC transporter ATP-binding protein, partial [Micromonospora sp.]